MGGREPGGRRAAKFPNSQNLQNTNPRVGTRRRSEDSARKHVEESEDNEMLTPDGKPWLIPGSGFSVKIPKKGEPVFKRSFPSKKEFPSKKARENPSESVEESENP